MYLVQYSELQAGGGKISIFLHFTPAAVVLLYAKDRFLLHVSA